MAYGEIGLRFRNQGHEEWQDGGQRRYPSRGMELSGVVWSRHSLQAVQQHNDHGDHTTIIREEASIFAPQRIPFYKDPRVAACTVGKVRSSTVFMCVCSTFRPSDFLLYVKNGFVVGVRCQGNREPPADSATTPLSH